MPFSSFFPFSPPTSSSRPRESNDVSPRIICTLSKDSSVPSSDGGSVAPGGACTTTIVLKDSHMHHKWTPNGPQIRSLVGHSNAQRRSAAATWLWQRHCWRRRFCWNSAGSSLDAPPPRVPKKKNTGLVVCWGRIYWKIWKTPNFMVKTRLKKKKELFANQLFPGFPINQAIERKDVSFWGLVAVGSPPRFLRAFTMMWFRLVGIPLFLFREKERHCCICSSKWCR